MVIGVRGNASRGDMNAGCGIGARGGTITSVSRTRHHREPRSSTDLRITSPNTTVRPDTIERYLLHCMSLSLERLIHLFTVSPSQGHYTGHIIMSTYRFGLLSAIAIVMAIVRCTVKDAQQHSSASRDYERSRFEGSMIDIVARNGYAMRGDTVTFVARHDSLAGEGSGAIYFVITTCYADNSLPTFDLVRSNNRTAQGELAYRFVIPANAAWIQVNVADSHKILQSHGMREFPVVVAEEQPARNTNAYALRVAPKEEYQNHVAAELAHYPDNVLIYAAKWAYQLNNRLGTPDTIVEDLMRVAKFKWSEERDVVEFIGFCLTGDQRILDVLPRLRNMKNSSVFNHWMVIGCLQNSILASTDKFIDSARFDIIGDIAANNPFSEYTEFRLRDGSMQNVPIRQVVEICDTRLARRPDPPSLVTKMLALARKAGEDSIKTLYRTAQLLDQYLQDTSFDARRLDPLGNIYERRAFLLGVVADAYVAGEDFQRAESTLRRALDESLPFSSNQAIAYQRLGRAFRLAGKRDSALRYYGFSYLAGEYFEPVKDSVWNDLVRLSGNPDSATRVVAMVRPFYKAETSTLHVPTPRIVTIDDQSYQLQSLQRDLILEFVAEDCPPCFQNVRKLALLKKSGKLKDVDVVVIARESPDVIIPLLRRQSADFPIAKEGATLFGLFNVYGTPVTLRFGPDATVRYRLDGGGGDFNF